jgi:hypothetical protein
LRSAIIDFASKPKFLKDFGIDLDTAREVERAINHAPGLKSAMDQFPSIVKGLLNGDVAREHFRSIAHKIPSSPDALAVLKQCVETDTDAILDATTRTDQFKAATQFMGRLAAYGVKTQ